MVLALFPMMYGIEEARLYFNVAFFVVLVSLVLQGWTIAPAARLLRLEVPPQTEPVQELTLDMPGHFEHEMACFEGQEGSLIVGRVLGQLELPAGMQVMAVIRSGRPQPLSASFRGSAQPTNRTTAIPTTGRSRSAARKSTASRMPPIA